MKSVLVLGGITGFVGRNIADFFEDKCEILRTSRSKDNNVTSIYFDLQDKASWKNVSELNPDVIINCAAYGVVKTETDLAKMYDINYFTTTAFYKFLQEQKCDSFWVQIGTAFEYDLSVSDIKEESPCLPQTHYGISKLMTSNYLFEYGKKGKFIVLRPFGMFGKYEDSSKLFPALILAQLKNETINLSSGIQQRDYLFVKDLAIFIWNLMTEYEIRNLPKLINIGSGTYKPICKIAETIAQCIHGFQPELWNWGSLGQREGEASYFYNQSGLAAQYGLSVTKQEEAFPEIIENYKANYVA